MRRSVWLLVSGDKYELPLAIRDTAREIAKVANSTERSVVSSFSKYKTGVVKTCRFRKVEFDD